MTELILKGTGEGFRIEERGLLILLLSGIYGCTIFKFLVSSLKDFFSFLFSIFPSLLFCVYYNA